jgi:hypothetical protein
VATGLLLLFVGLEEMVERKRAAKKDRRGLSRAEAVLTAD